MQPHRVHTVTIEVTHERGVTRVPELERELRSPQPAIIGTQRIDDEEPVTRRPIDRHRVTPIPIEVTHQRHITGITEEERPIRHTLGVRIPQIHVPVGLAIQPRRVHTVTIPVPHERHITGIPEEERRRGPRHRITEEPHPRTRIHHTHTINHTINRTRRRHPHPTHHHTRHHDRRQARSEPMHGSSDPSCRTGSAAV